MKVGDTYYADPAWCGAAIEELHDRVRNALIAEAKANKARTSAEAERDKLLERCDGYKGQVKAGADEIERLRAENRRLRAALEPFALAGDCFEHDTSEFWRVGNVCLSTSKFRRARAALGQT